MKNISVNELLANPALYSEENAFGFYDWHCSDAALKGRYRKLLPILRWLVKVGVIDGDKYYVWFKNIGAYPLYDDMRFSTLDEDDCYVGGVAPSKYSYWLASEDFEEHSYGSLEELKSVLNKETFTAPLK